MDEAAALLELQSVDIDMLRAERKLDELPEKKAILVARAKQRETAQLKERASLLVRKLEAEVKVRQDEIAMLTSKIDHEQTTLMATSDHRQVQAISREMDGLRRRRDKLEMETLQFIERVDKASAQIGAIEVHLANMAQQEVALTDDFKKVGGAIQSSLTKLKSRRKKLAATVSPELLKRYDSMRISKGGVGVGALEGESCSACRMQLPSERIKDLLVGPDVAICPHCRRLIVVRVVETVE